MAEKLKNSRWYLVINLFLSLVVFLVAIFWGLIRFVSSANAKFSLNGDIAAIQNKILWELIKHNVELWVVYLFLITASILLILFKKKVILGTTLVICLALILLMEFLSAVNVATSFKKSLIRSVYPGTRIYSFDNNINIGTSNRTISFEANDDIQTVFDYYKTHLPQGTIIDDPEQIVEVDYISDEENVVESKNLSAQLRIDILGNNSLPDYIISLWSQKDSKVTKVTMN